MLSCVPLGQFKCFADSAIEARLVRADGTRLEVLQRGMVETDPSGRRHGYLIVLTIVWAFVIATRREEPTA